MKTDTDKELFFGVFDRFTNKCYFTGRLTPAELLTNAPDGVDWTALQLWLKNILQNGFAQNVTVSIGVTEIND